MPSELERAFEIASIINNETIRKEFLAAWFAQENHVDPETVLHTLGTETGHNLMLPVTTDGCWWFDSVDLNEIDQNSVKFGSLTEGSSGGYSYPLNSFLLFEGVSIPQGSKINKVILKFYPYDTINSPAITSQVLIACERSGNAQPILSAQDAENRTYSDPVYWGVPVGASWQELTETETPDFSLGLQQTVNDPAWTGQNLQVFLMPYGSAETYWQVIDTYQTWWYPDKQAVLSVWYDAIYSELGTGGVRIGTSVVPFGITNERPTGGARLGGAAQISGRMAFLSGSGGIRLGGQSQETYFGSGGLRCGGSARTWGTQSTESIGGVKAGGGYKRWAGEYDYRVLITVPAGKVTSNLEGFYLGITTTLDPSHVGVSQFAIQDQTGKTLASETRDYDPVTGQVWVYFNCDLSSTVDNHFYLLYGSA